MKKVIVVLILCFLTSQIFAQLKEGDLQMSKSFWGVKIHQDGRILKPKEVLSIMETNPAAKAEFIKAKSNYDAANVCGFIGGFMVGWPLGTALGGGDPEWGVAAGGAVVLLFSIPFNSGFSKHAKNAITMYNSDSETVSNRNPYSIQVVPYGAGAKFLIKF